MPTNFRNSIRNDIGTEPEDVVVVPTGFRTTIIGCNLTNVLEYDNIKVTVHVVDVNSSIAGTYAQNIVIPPESTLKLVTNGEKIILDQDTTLRIVSNKNSSIDAVISYVEIS